MSVLINYTSVGNVRGYDDCWFSNGIDWHGECFEILPYTTTISCRCDPVGISEPPLIAQEPGLLSRLFLIVAFEFESPDDRRDFGAVLIKSRDLDVVAVVEHAKTRVTES